MKVSLIQPFDQPLGRRRLLKELQTHLADPAFNEWFIIVAFAKSGPLLRLASDIRAWRLAGKEIRAVFGVDQFGTSREALDFGLREFDSLNIVHASSGSAFNPTFHPKIYLFVGQDSAVCYIGSNNLTVGGTETNFEAAVVFELDLPGDIEFLNRLREQWTEAIDSSIEASPEVIRQLEARRLVTTEAEQRTARRAAAASARTRSRPDLPDLFPSLQLFPPSAVPRAEIQPKRKKVRAIGVPTAAANSADTLVMQIVPHPNGEVFLSKQALDQNPSFFGWPWPGITSPKRKGNKGYPQKIPDPIVSISVFDASGAKILNVADFGLNTVYYSAKSEIRVTIRADVLAATPAFSILVMQAAVDDASRDYDMVIYAPGSEQYKKLLTACNQTMPAGQRNGKARKFGWL